MCDNGKTYISQKLSIIKAWDRNNEIIPLNDFISAIMIIDIFDT